MPRTKRLNGLPSSIGQSYLSTSKYYAKGYMADWLNSIALKTGHYDIEIDIIRDKTTPRLCRKQALVAWNSEFRNLISKVLQNEGFEQGFIREAIMKFHIRSRKGQNNLIKCKVVLKDENGRVYQNKKPIQDEAYEAPFEPFSILDRRRYLQRRS